MFQHLATAPTAAAFMDGFHAAVFAGGTIVAVGILLAVLLPAGSRAETTSLEPALEAA